MNIIGTPEGRPGIWLIEPEIACSLLNELSVDAVHNFMAGGGPVYIGANWSKQDVCDLLAKPEVRIAMMFPPNVTMLHQLVVINDERRWSFDVGVIAEDRMQVAAEATT